MSKPDPKYYPLIRVALKITNLLAQLGPLKSLKSNLIQGV